MLALVGQQLDMLGLPLEQAISHSRSSLGSCTVVLMVMPPLSFFLKVMAGGRLFRRIPKPSSSFSIRRLWEMGFRQSSTIRMRLQVRAVEMTCSISVEFAGQTNTSGVMLLPYRMTAQQHAVDVLQQTSERCWANEVQ